MGGKFVANLAQLLIEARLTRFQLAVCLDRVASFLLILDRFLQNILLSQELTYRGKKPRFRRSRD